MSRTSRRSKMPSSRRSTTSPLPPATCSPSSSLALERDDGDAVAVVLERVHEGGAMVAVHRLDCDLDLGRTNGSGGEQPLVLHLDDVAAGLADDGGQTRQRTRTIVEPHSQSP